MATESRYQKSDVMNGAKGCSTLPLHNQEVRFASTIPVIERNEVHPLESKMLRRCQCRKA